MIQPGTTRQAVTESAALTATRLARSLLEAGRLAILMPNARRDLNRVALTAKAASCLGASERRELLTYLSLL